MWLGVLRQAHPHRHCLVRATVVMVVAPVLGPVLEGILFQQKDRKRTRLTLLRELSWFSTVSNLIMGMWIGTPSPFCMLKSTCEPAGILCRFKMINNLLARLLISKPGVLKFVIILISCLLQLWCGLIGSEANVGA